MAEGNESSVVVEALRSVLFVFLKLQAVIFGIDLFHDCVTDLSKAKVGRI